MQVHADVHHAHRLSERTKKAVRHLYCPPRADEAYSGRLPDRTASIGPYQIHRTACVRTFSSDGRCPRVRFDPRIGRAGAHDRVAKSDGPRRVPISDGPRRPDGLIGRTGALDPSDGRADAASDGGADAGSDGRNRTAGSDGVREQPRGFLQSIEFWCFSPFLLLQPNSLGLHALQESSRTSRTILSTVKECSNIYCASH
jgi:hypothetical protein